MRKTYRYRLYPTAAQTEALDAQLGEACRLYNAALQERRDAYQRDGLSLNYYDQASQLKGIRELEIWAWRTSPPPKTCCAVWTKPSRRSFVASKLVTKPAIRASSPADASTVTPSPVRAMDAD